jgi:secernin
MCDTLVALGNSTKNGSVLFAKNSDREFNEAQYLELIEGKSYQNGEKVKCTYIEIPQVNRTNTILLSKPFWIWGAEMGANDHGVVIGNEAVFTKVGDAKTARLIGMDLLRLGLERAKTAEEAMHVIIELLETYGQGGNCGFTHPFFYDNSYLIADAKYAWVLETAGKQWAAEKVKDIRSISNIITIGSKWDLASKDLVQYSIDRGWCRDRSTFNFRKCYSDLIYSNFGAGASRHSCTEDFLRQRKTKLEAVDLMKNLRTHASAIKTGWKPDAALMGADVCMHAGFGPIRVSQTTGSMISELTAKNALHWFTGTSAPCTSLFKPVWFEGGIPEMGLTPTGTFTPNSLWWEHEKLHRTILQDYPTRMAKYQPELDTLQTEFVDGIAKDKIKSFKQKREYSEKCFSDELNQLGTWVDELSKLPKKSRNAFYYDSMLNSINKAGEFPLK